MNQKNKRGQGLSVTTLILIVLGIVVLVVVILGFTKGWNFVFGKIDILPGQSLQTAVKSCEISAQQELTVDYCNEFKEVKLAGKKQWITCDYIVDAGIAALEKTIDDCPDYRDLAVEFCTNLDKPSATVNGGVCSEGWV